MAASGKDKIRKYQDDLKFSGEEIVISGISGVFPKSRDVLEFMENLYNKVDMVSSDEPRWSFNDPDVPKHIGKINGLEKFDAQFFRVGFQVGCVLEPMARKLLEHAYGAIIDSGSNLIELKQKKVGVFIGSSFTDSSTLSMDDISKRNDFIISGCSKAMFANRISYWVDGKGPSYNLDYACSSSMACLEQACKSMKAGECDAALIGGCNYCTQPCLTINLRRAGLLCLDGKTKCFDKKGDGYARSDAVNILFLQKVKDAKRVYAQVCHAKGMYKMKANAPMLPIRDPDDMQKFFEEFYLEINLSPEEIEYVEANGAAIAEADGNELEAIGRVFAKGTNVKVGCVKSNMGHSEPASGACALTKLCLAYHQGRLPANLHYNEPQNHIPAVNDGKIQVTVENEPFSRGYAAVNSFSYTGANFHALLKGHYKRKDHNKYKSKLPHIILVSGRQESCLSKIFGLLKSQPLDPEQIALLRNVFKHDISGHTGRGYTILDTNDKNETVSLSESVDYYSGKKRPLWFVYSGMGSQWVGMGSNLMQIPVFAAAIERCHKVLEPNGMDIYKILTDTDDKQFDNILSAFVGIGAIQIGLTDVLKEIGLVPDYIIGHSLGEMACAYHDNTFTTEELILSTYWRGSICLKLQGVKGSMAAVGLGYKDILSECPPEIDVACHNSFESSTISGPADVMKEFVADLTKRGIFAREVPCANIAYHSRYVAQCGPELVKALRDVIKDPKPRSKKWISSSIPMDRWDESLAKYSSAEYHVNNLLSPVLFEEMSKLIPANAIVVEVAPHGLLQAILKRSLKECTHVPLTRRGNKDGVKFLLDAIGKLYQVGLNPNVEKLYPQIEYPVSTETPFLSHFVEWEHSEDWPDVKYKKVEKIIKMARNLTVSTEDDDYKYFVGHVRDGINIMPESAILVFIWETLAMYNKMNYRDMSIVFRDVHFHTEVIITPNIPVRLSIVRSKGNDTFEVSQEDIVIASGIVNNDIQIHHNIYNTVTEEDCELNSEDIYKFLHLRGFDYKDQFQSIHSMNLARENAYVKCNNDWVTFLDSLIQLNILSKDHDGISVPKFIQKVSINVVDHKKYIPVEVKDVSCYNARLNTNCGVTWCTGVKIDNITFVDKPKVEKEPDVLGVKKFFPYYMMENIALKTALQIIFQIVAENVTTKGLQITELVEKHVSDIFLKINEVVNDFAFSDVKIVSVNFENSNIDDLTKTGENFRENICVIENLLEDEKKINKLSTYIRQDAFVIAIEKHVPTRKSTIKENFNLITSMSDGKQILFLLRKLHLKQNDIFIRIPYDVKFSWINNFYSELQKTTRVVLVSERQPLCGLEGLIKKLKRDGVEKVGLLVIEDFSAPRFNPEDDFYKEQLNKNLSINILKKGRWGGYYYTECTQSIHLRNVSLTCSSPGDLDSLTWVEASPVASKNTLVQVSFSGLSFRDIQKAVYDVNNKNNAFGMDYSGLDKMGERVMGVVLDGAINSTVEADLDLLWPVPEHWSLEDAATVPLPYLHAYYCLTIKAQLFEGQSVLVTGGAGALGQAVISVCLSLDCTVYTTVSDIKKKQLLLKLFPSLDENNIGYSRHYYFYNKIICNSKKRCDIVINCATGSIRDVAMKCVGFTGFFLDISNYDMTNNRNIGMFYLACNRSYKSVNLSSIFRPENVNDKKKLQILIADGIAKGIVKPLSRVVYSPMDVSRAFKILSSSKQSGRVLVRMRDPIILSQGIKVIPRMTYSSNGVYVVICDKTGLGLELVDRIIKQGAKKILLHLKSDFVSGYVRTKFLSWTREDLSIRLSSENLQTEQGCVKLLKDAAKLGQVNGIFIIHDTKIENSYVDKQKDFVDKFNKFSLIVLNLDLSSRNFCPSLSHFVVIVQPSQNDSEKYAAAVAERICQTRREIGCPALVLKIGSPNEFTALSAKSQFKEQSQKITLLFSALERSLKMKYNNVVFSTINSNSDTVFLDKIANILGFKTLNDAKDISTVQDYILNDVNLEAIRVIIKKMCQVEYPIDKIKQFAIGSLKTLNNRLNTNKEIKHGLDAFFNNIDDEEDYISIPHPIVPKVTMLNNATENDLDPSETYLIMIPGFDGRHQTYNTITEMLKIQAVTVQLGVDINEESISELAMSVRKSMKTKFETSSKFYLLGYSFGVNVALELAALLEEEGQVGVVFCLDSSPDALRIQMNAYLGKLSETQLQNAIIKHIYQLMTGHLFTKNLENIQTWPEKVEIYIQELKGMVNYSNQYKRCILMTAYKRIILAREYEPNFKLESQLVLMKGIPHPEGETLADDYNLSKYTKQPVRVFDIQSDHYSATENYQVSNIVNRMLDPKLLEVYKTKCHCETYVM